MGSRRNRICTVGILLVTSRFLSTRKSTSVHHYLSDLDLLGPFVPPRGGTVRTLGFAWVATLVWHSAPFSELRVSLGLSNWCPATSRFLRSLGLIPKPMHRTQEPRQPAPGAPGTAVGPNTRLAAGQVSPAPRRTRQRTSLSRAVLPPRTSRSRLGVRETLVRSLSSETTSWFRLVSSISAKSLQARVEATAAASPRTCRWPRGVSWAPGRSNLVQGPPRSKP